MKITDAYAYTDSIDRAFINHGSHLYGCFNIGEIMFISTWEQERENRYIFRLVCDTKMKNLCKIYPINQRAVNGIFDAVHDDPRIDMIVIFGSSLNFRCNYDSDIDLAIKLKPGFVSNEVKDSVSYRIQEACDWRADILWRDRISEREEILEEIRKGVILE